MQTWVGTLILSLCPPRPPYLQRQLQAQVFRIVTEYSPGRSEEDVVNCGGLVLDVMLRVPGATVRA